jgi:hypothetical protein
MRLESETINATPPRASGSGSAHDAEQIARALANGRAISRNANGWKTFCPLCVFRRPATKTSTDALAHSAQRHPSRLLPSLQRRRRRDSSRTGPTRVATEHLPGIVGGVSRGQPGVRSRSRRDMEGYCRTNRPQGASGPSPNCAPMLQNRVQRLIEGNRRARSCECRDRVALRARSFKPGRLTRTDRARARHTSRNLASANPQRERGSGCNNQTCRKSR